MDYFIALLSTGKGTWAEVNKLIASKEWKKIILICNSFAFESFTAPQKAVKLLLDTTHQRQAMQTLAKELRKEIPDIDVALNIISGTGKEHMIILSSILKAGLSPQFYILEDNKPHLISHIDQKFVFDHENVL